jgi:hypothetical protein
VVNHSREIRFNAARCLDTHAGRDARCAVLHDVPHTFLVVDDAQVVRTDAILAARVVVHPLQFFLEYFVDDAVNGLAIHVTFSSLYKPTLQYKSIHEKGNRWKQKAPRRFALGLSTSLLRLLLQQQHFIEGCEGVAAINRFRFEPIHVDA